MSFAILNTFSFCYSHRSNSFSRKDVITGSLDCLCIGASIVAGRVFLANVFDLSAHSHLIGWGLISGGFIAALLDSTIVCLKLKNQPKKNQLKPPTTIPRSTHFLDYQAISDDTIILMEQGNYVNKKGKKISFQNVCELYENSQICIYKDYKMQPVSSRYQQKVSVIEKDCLDVAHSFVKTGNNVVVVNFAGPGSPGGGFLEGTAGQEEVLIYRCDLAAFMKYCFDAQTCDPEKFTMYPLTNHLIHTPNVTVFKDRDFELLDQPFKIGVLSAAAPVSKSFCNMASNAFDIRIQSNGEAVYSDEETRELMKQIIYVQLKVAYDEGYDTIVTGAFGCGAFKNPPNEVAKLFNDVIEEYFQGAFKAIIFAILEVNRKEAHNPEGNIAPFKRYFS